MTSKVLRKISGVLILLVALSVPLFAADHGDSPQVRFDPRLDIPDVYAFQSPSNPANTVLIMTTNPVAGIVSPTTFSPTGRYFFFVDTDGDAIADISIRVTFSDIPGGGQRVRLSTQGDASFSGSGTTGQNITLSGGGLLRADRFDDPFFFDFIAFRNGLSFKRPGINFFRGLNVLAIVVEVPSSIFGTNNIGVWAITRQGTKQIDRNGRPVINTVLIPGPNKDAFNSGRPRNDRRDFRDDAVASLTALGAADPEALADFLLPDILTINTSSSDGFPNGRRLEDDVIDIELALVTNGKVKSDFVKNDGAPFLNTFPYLKAPNP